MIKPNKDIKLSYSLIGVGAELLSKMHYPTSISALWNKVNSKQNIGSFEKFILTLDFLYMCNLIELKNNLIRKVNHD